MGNEWTIGAVGPQHRAVMKDGEVRAIAEDVSTAVDIARALNGVGHPGDAAVMRDMLESLHATLAEEQQAAEDNMRNGITPWVSGPMLAREDVIAKLAEILKVGQGEPAVMPRLGTRGGLVQVSVIKQSRPYCSLTIAPGDEHLHSITEDVTIRVDWA